MASRISLPEIFVATGFSFCRGQVLVVEVCFDLLGQLQPGLVLRVGVGVHQDRCRCMTCVALHRLEVTVRLQELVGGTGVPQTVEHDLFKLWMLGSPQAIPLCQQFRCDGQAVREPEQLPAVAVLLRGVLLVLLHLFQPCQKLGFQRLGHIQDAVGLLGLGLFQDEGTCCPHACPGRCGRPDWGRAFPKRPCWLAAWSC